jgi:hypothetical protein
LKAAIRNAEVEKAKAEARSQFHQHFLRQKRDAFAHIIVGPFYGRKNLTKKHKLMVTCQNLKSKVFIKISAQLMVQYKLNERKFHSKILSYNDLGKKTRNLKTYVILLRSHNSE